MNDHLIEQYKLLYEQKPSYGASSQKIFNIVLQVINQYKPNTILDYGCGRSRLLDMISEQIDVNIFKYDPVFEMYSQLPKQKVDFVICTDVLQHVPELELFDNLFEISQLGDKCFLKLNVLTTQLASQMGSLQIVPCMISSGGKTFCINIVVV